MKKILYFFSLISLLINQLSAQVSICGKNIRVVGYQPSWSGSVSGIQFGKLTDINYAFALPNSDGTLQVLDQPAFLLLLQG